MAVLLKLPREIDEVKLFLEKYNFSLIKNQPQKWLAESDVKADAIRIPSGHIFPVRKNHTKNMLDKSGVQIPFQLISVSCTFFKGDPEEEILRFSLLPTGSVFPNTFNEVKRIISEYENSIWEGTGND